MLAPVKLPGKFINVIKYIGLGLGIIESIIVEKDDDKSEGEVDRAKLPAADNVLKNNVDDIPKKRTIQTSLAKYDLGTGKEETDETE